MLFVMHLINHIINNPDPPRTKLKELENRITLLENEIGELNSGLSAPNVAGDYSKLAPVLERLKTADAELESAMEEWSSLSDSDV